MEQHIEMISRLRECALPLVAAGLVVLTGCGESITTTAGKDESSSVPAPLPKTLDMDITPTGGDEFMVVNGAVGTGDYHPGAEFVRVTPTTSTVVAQLDIPLRSPVAWTNPDGSVTAIGLDCSEDGDEDRSLACERPEFVRADIQPDDSIETRKLDLTTIGPLGVDAVRSPSGEIHVLAHPEGSYSPHVYRFAPDGADAVDLGVVEARRLCQATDRAFVYPFDVSRGSFSRALYELTRTGVERLPDIDAFDTDVTTVSPCSPDGSVIVGGLMGTEVTYHSINLSDPTTVIPLEVPAEYAKGTLQPGHGNDLLSWTDVEAREEMSGSDTWQLNQLRDGTWASLGSVESSVIPELTTAGQDAVAAVVTGPEGRKIEVLP